MTLLIFFLVLSIIVMVHEFGHFIVAKKNGIRVEEFGLGIPPRLFGKKFGETLYSVNLLPFGGFVKLTGEDDTEGLSAKDPRSFVSKNMWQKSAVLLAGVFMNVLLGVTIFYLILGFNGFKAMYIPLYFGYEFPTGDAKIVNTVITGFSDDSPAEEAGVEYGEAVVEIDGVSVDSVEEVREALVGKLDQPVMVKLLDISKRNVTAPRELEIVPTVAEDGSVVFGVYLGKSVQLSYTKPVQKVFSGFMHSYNMLAYSLNSMGKLLEISFETKDISPVSESVSGPVGIYHLVGGILKYGGNDTLYILLDYVALMSLSLAIMNVLPFPALDGGRLMFVLYEGITKKKINPKVESILNQFGFLLLMGLLVLVTIKDILR